MTLWQRLYFLFCSPRLLHVVLPALMAYLVIGTVAQKYVGLYEATKIWFAAPILWVGPVPLPGMPVLVGLVFLNLAFKLFFASPWNWRNAGNIITHIGAMLLLLGGLFTALFSHEGYIALGEGEIKSIISDYHAREFVVRDYDGNELIMMDHKDIALGHLSMNNLPFALDIIERCEHCAIAPRENATENHISMAQHMQLSPAPLKINNEENMSGFTFQVKHDDVKEIHVVLEDVPKLPHITIDDKEYVFQLRRAERILPFSIELLDFEKHSYPGTTMAREYQSTVLVKDGDLEWQSVISMNAPLRYKGYTFFQSSFLNTPQGEISVLAAVWNVGRAFPYISGIVMCIGLLLHLFIRRRFAALALMLCLFSPDVYAKNLNMDGFARLPILHEGRMKPIDSFARAHLKTLSGRESGAVSWLVEVLFNPVTARDQVTIKITNPDVLNILELKRRSGKSYSNNELIEALSKKENLIKQIINANQDNWSAQHRALIDLYQKTMDFHDLSISAAAFIPMPTHVFGNLPDKLLPELAKSEITPYFLFSQKTRIDTTLKNIIKLKGTDIDNYTDDEIALTNISFIMNSTANLGLQHKGFNIIHVGDAQWVTPWQAVKSDESTMILELWSDLARAYRTQDSALWDQTLTALHAHNEHIETLRHTALDMEYFYGVLAPFTLSYALCLLAGVLLITSAFIKPKLSQQIALFLLIAVLIQIIGVGMRMFILWRPPVTTLYETVLFVTPIVMAYMLFLYKKNGLVLWLALATIAGIALHMLGFAHDQDGDSLVNLTAVLNTNFWLTTHVLTITAGYAFCAITALMAHYILGLMVWKKKLTPDASLFKHMQSAALIALFFATIGTVLGGIWADQSWGRFWGWDPKENGALLICLWLIWALHGRISGQLNSRGVLYAMSYLSVILGLSWFGVNILSVGLHAYGFTDSMAISLAVFITAETAFLTFAATYLKGLSHA